MISDEKDKPGCDWPAPAPGHFRLLGDGNNHFSLTGSTLPVGRYNPNGIGAGCKAGCVKNHRFSGTDHLSPGRIPDKGQGVTIGIESCSRDFERVARCHLIGGR